MNIGFLIGKIISDIDFKFIVNSKKYYSISTFQIELNNKSVITVKGYNEIADFCYRRLLKNGYINDVRGTYVDPRLVNYIAIWASPKYAVCVGKIMDSINDKVHEVLNEKQLPDTPENAKPVFIEVAKQIAPSINQEFLENQCWGCRDSIKTLDQWEQDDLKRDIREYKEIKKRLEEVERKVDSWGLFLKQYHPEFEK